MGMVAEGEEGEGVLVEFCRFKWEGVEVNSGRVLGVLNGQRPGVVLV